MLAGEASVGVPSPVKNLDISHAAFSEASGVKATGSERACLSCLFPIELEGLVTFRGQIHQFRNGGLHPKGHFVLLDTGQCLRVKRLFMLAAVEGGQGIKLSSTVFSGCPLWVAQIENGISFAPQKNALMFGRKKAGTPETVEQALLREARLGVHHDIAGEILIHGPEPIAQPGSEARPSGDLTPGLDIGYGRIMVDRFRKGAVHHTKLLGDFAGFRKKFTCPKAVLVIRVFGELVFRGTDRMSFLASCHSGNPLPVPDMFGQVLTEHIPHLRFVVPRINVTGTAAHEKVDDPLGSGSMVDPAV